MTCYRFWAVFSLLLMIGCGGGGSSDTASSPAQAAAAAFEPRLAGVAFGPYVDGSDPDLGASVDSSTISSLLNTLFSSGTGIEWIRTYGSLSGLQFVADLAHASGFKLAHGIWVNGNATTTQAQIDAAIDAANAGLVDALIVGSETLLRGEVSPTQLVDYIQQVRAAVPQDILVMYADVYHILAINPAVIEAVDVVCAHMHPYWSGISLDNAVAAIDAWYESLVDLADSKPVWVCEAGWPADGSPRGNAVPELAQSVDYLTNFLSWAESKSVQYFYFEAFDEPWKSRLEGDVGDHWGVWDQFGNLKSGMGSPLLDGDRVANNWSGTRVVGGPGDPEIAFTTVPARGTSEDLFGRVNHVNPLVYTVAVYIRVSGRWWTKPTFAQPLTPINPDGTFRTDVTTGGSDTQASEIRAYLLPIGVSAPRASGRSTLPASLDDISVASASVVR